ncbi:MAG TPA: ferredoxin [bacterium]|nr:ferredoxin [bacterium]
MSDPQSTSIDPAKISAIRSALGRVPHVNESCIGCGACVAISGTVFEMNDDGMSIVLSCDSYE